MKHADMLPLMLVAILLMVSENDMVWGEWPGGRKKPKSEEF
jgi:hypothetical protein